MRRCAFCCSSMCPQRPPGTWPQPSRDRCLCLSPIYLDALLLHAVMKNGRGTVGQQPSSFSHVPIRLEVRSIFFTMPATSPQPQRFWCPWCQASAAVTNPATLNPPICGYCCCCFGISARLYLYGRRVGLCTHSLEAKHNPTKAAEVLCYGTPNSHNRGPATSIAPEVLSVLQNAALRAVGVAEERIGCLHGCCEACHQQKSEKKGPASLSAPSGHQTQTPGEDTDTDCATRCVCEGGRTR